MKLGVDIGGTHIGIGVVNGERVIEKIEESTSKTNVVEFIIKNAKAYMDKYNIELLGIGYCGTVKNGIIEKSPNLNIEECNIKGILEKELNLPIIIRNDAKCAGLAEKYYGAMKEYSDCVLLTIGTGIGGAYFYNGSLLEPRKYSGFEFGHMVIEKEGRKCNCGNLGCFEQYASITALKREVKNKLNITEELEGIELKKIIEENIQALEPVLEKYSENLAIGISNIIRILEPEIIVLGGSFAYYKDILLDRVIKYIKAFNKEKPIIEIAKLKNDAGMIGACV